MIIGIHGKAESGKTTVTNMLMQYLPDCSTDAFANPIKDMLAAIGVDCSDHMKNVVHPILGKTPRQLMNSLGNEWGRDLVSEDLWVDLLNSHTRDTNHIISDVRRENEAEYIRENLDGIIIHIRGRGGIEGNYASEQGILKAPKDYVIVNDGTLEQLQIKVLEVLVEIALK